jgi:hypothetical protein
MALSELSSVGLVPGEPDPPNSATAMTAMPMMITTNGITVRLDRRVIRRSGIESGTFRIGLGQAPCRSAHVTTLRGVAMGQATD